jgi:hypothetical protein
VVEEGRRSQRKNEDRLADLDRQRRALPWD